MDMTLVGFGLCRVVSALSERCSKGLTELVPLNLSCNRLRIHARVSRTSERRLLQ